MKRIDKILMRLVLGLLAVPAFMASCSDEPLAENYYTFTGEMASDYLQNRSDQFSDFVAILQRSGLYGTLATYGSYTVFAPNNAAVEEYLHGRGLNSVDQLSKEECDTISWNHIIDEVAYFTMDLIDGNIPTANMNGRNLTFSCDTDEVNNNVAVYYINKTARLIARDDSVENGVVHTLDKMIVPQSDYLPDVMMEDPNISLFCEALRLTELDDTLRTPYIDPTYTCGADSVNQDMTVTTGGTDYTLRFVGTRMKRFSALVETDEVFAAAGIHTIEDLYQAAKANYDAVYPNDKGTYEDDDYTNPKNPLYRFVAYHLLPYYGAYNDWTVSGELKEVCAITELIDCTDWYTTLLPHTLMKFSSPNVGLYVNRKGLGARFEPGCEGVKVLSPSEMGSVDQQAINGIYHYIDRPLFYDVNTREVVFNDRIRVNVATLSTEFMNCGMRGNTERATGVKVIDGFTFRGTTPFMTFRQRWVWTATYSDCLDIVGQFDVTFKLPPVPTAGSYEVRFGYGAGNDRGKVQIYFGTSPDNVEPVGLPIDFTKYGGDPTIGWVEDDPDNELVTRANDKAMHARGYMKDMDSWQQGGVNVLRDNGAKFRKILVTETMNPNQDYYIRIKLVVDNPQAQLPVNYFELVPKSVYAGVEVEDTH